MPSICALHRPDRAQLSREQRGKVNKSLKAYELCQEITGKMIDDCGITHSPKNMHSRSRTHRSFFASLFCATARLHSEWRELPKGF